MSHTEPAAITSTARMAAPRRRVCGHPRLGLALAIAGVLGAAGRPATAAAIITVDSASGGSAPGHCSLRDAVRAANILATPPGSTCAPGDGSNTIVFAAGITDIVFHDPMEDGADSALVVTQELLIDGGPTGSGGVPRVTIERSSASGTPYFRLIESDASLTLRSLTLRNGHTVADDLGGGAIYSSTPPLYLSDCVVSGNRVEGDNALGGGIAVADVNFGSDSLTLLRSTISGNETDGTYGSGGGVFAPTATLRYSAVVGNVTRGFGARGGGVSATYVKFDASHVDNNATYGDNGRGGGIFAVSVNGNPTTGIPASFVGGNHTHGAHAAGGGIATFSADLYTTQVTGNATAGPGSDGGGISTDALTLGGSLIAGNRTVGDDAPGGGVYGRDVQLFNSTISGNATTGSDAPGGGVFAVGLQIFFSTISANQATRGAGVYMTSFNTQAPTLAAYSTLIFGNGSEPDIDASGIGTTISGDHDLVGNAGAHLNLPGDTLHCDPHLLPLGDFGGDTLTHALPDGSCAIDAAAAIGPDTDQRGPGFPRPYGATNDIGAYEAQPRPDPIFSDGFEPVALRAAMPR